MKRLAVLAVLVVAGMMLPTGCAAASGKPGRLGQAVSASEKQDYRCGWRRGDRPVRAFLVQRSAYRVVARGDVRPSDRVIRGCAFAVPHDYATDRWPNKRDLASACQTTTALNRSAPDWYGAEDLPVAVTIGDSWSVGGGLPSIPGAYPYLVAERMGWRMLDAGGSGTGYTTPGPCDDTYVHRAATIPQDARFVLLEGGINDAASLDSLRDLGPAVQRTVAVAQRRAPRARVVVLGLPRITFFTAAKNDRINDAMRAAARASGATWLPAPARVDLFWDRVHPTMRGHAEFAANIENRLTQPRYLLRG